MTGLVLRVVAIEGGPSLLTGINHQKIVFSHYNSGNFGWIISSFYFIILSDNILPSVRLGIQ